MNTSLLYLDLVGFEKLIAVEQITMLYLHLFLLPTSPIMDMSNLHHHQENIAVPSDYYIQWRPQSLVTVLRVPRFGPIRRLSYFNSDSAKS